MKAAEGKTYSQLAVEGALPSQARRKIGLLYDDLERKFLAKPIIRAMLVDRPSYVSVPIYVYDDLDAYSGFGLTICVQKIMYLMNGLLATPGSPEHVKSTEARDRLDRFLAVNDLLMVDEIDKILKVQDRFSFIAKFNSFMAT